MIGPRANDAARKVLFKPLVNPLHVTSRFRAATSPAECFTSAPMNTNLDGIVINAFFVAHIVLDFQTVNPTEVGCAIEQNG